MWRDTRIDWWKRIESPGRGFHILGNLIYDSGGITNQWIMHKLINKCSHNNWLSIVKDFTHTQFSFFFIAHTKLNDFQID